MLVPNDRNISTILVLADTVPKEFVETPKLFERKLCLVDIVDWKAESYQPLGRFVETIGDVFNLSHETRALLMQHQVRVLGARTPASRLTDQHQTARARRNGLPARQLRELVDSARRVGAPPRLSQEARVHD